MGEIEYKPDSFENFKERLRLTGHISTHLGQLHRTLRAFNIMAPDEWFKYCGSMAISLTGDREEGTFDEEDEDLLLRWLYYGDSRGLELLEEWLFDVLGTRAERDLQRQEQEGPLSAGYIYVIRSERRCKIGKARNPQKRITDHAIASPYKLERLFAIKVRDYDNVERTLHAMYKAKKAKGEWFELDEADIEAVRAYLQDREVA